MLVIFLNFDYLQLGQNLTGPYLHVAGAGLGLCELVGSCKIVLKPQLVFEHQTI